MSFREPCGEYYRTTTHGASCALCTLDAGSTPATSTILQSPKYSGFVIITIFDFVVYKHLCNDTVIARKFVQRRNMLRLIIGLFFTIVSTSIAGIYGELKISPDNPTVTTEVSLTYNSGSYFGDTKLPLFAFVYYFNERDAYPNAVSYPLEVVKKNNYTCTISKFPTDAVFALIKIGDGRNFDWNNDKMWDFMVYSSKKPIRGAYLRNGLSYLGAVVPSIKRTSDLDKAKIFLQKEIEAYPENIQAKIGYTSLRKDKGELDEPQYNRLMQDILALPYNKKQENEVRAVSRALRTIGKPADADELEKQWLKDNPTSDLAEEIQRIKCMQSTTPEDFENNVKEYIGKFKYNIFSDKFYIDLVSFYLKQGKGDEAIRVVRGYPTPPGVNSNPPASLLNMMAVTLLQQDSLLALARQYSERAIRAGENVDIMYCPKFITKEEFEFSNKEVYGISHDTYGVILRRMNKLDEAVEAFKKCEEVLGESASGDMLEHQAEALAASGKKSESIETMRRAIRTARGLAPTIQRFKEYTQGNSEKGDSELQKLMIESKSAKQRKLIAEMMNYDIQSLDFTKNDDGSKMKVNDFKLTTLSGKEVTLADLKGKVAVVDFWATWCGPCVMSMPYMQKLYEKYQGNKNVEILLVNVWERVEDRKKTVQDFLKNRSTFTFPMYMDLKDQVVGCFGVTGIPTKFYIDKKGIVQFKEVGFPGADVFVDEASERIDLLLEQE